MKRRSSTAVLVSLLAVPMVMSVGPAAAASTATPVVTGLSSPTMFTIAPDGRIFYAESRLGRIGVFNPADSSSSTYFQVPDLCNQRDQGLYGLALHSSFPAVATVYAYATRRKPDGSCSNQVLKLDGTVSGAQAMTVLLEDPYTAGHIGGRLLFGPDGNLYLSTGDGASGSSTQELSRTAREKVQDLNSLKGKILRLTPSGRVPADNPFGNHVFATGFRNVFGFDFDPSTGQLWAVDNGPDDEYPGAPLGPGPFGGCNDELDLVLKGSNQGWGPNGSCGEPPEAPLNSNRDGPNPVMPKWNIEVASGVTGGRFCNGCGLGPENEGRLLYVDYDHRDGLAEIRAATLGADRATVVSDAVVYRPPGDAPLSIERGPDGTLYYSDMQGIYKLSSPSSIVLTLSQASPTVVNLRWSGASGTSTDVWRRPGGTATFTKVATSNNDGNHNDSPGPGTWDYRVCNAGTTTCSNTASITVGGTTTTVASSIVLTLSQPSPTVVNLRWSGASGTSTDVWRQPSGSASFSKVATSNNDGNHNDSPGPGTWDYRVCNGGTTTCSNIATITL